MGDLFDLSGLSAIVTGGNTGIGLGIANALCSQGANVAIVARDEARNQDALAKLAVHGTQVEAYRCDVSEEGAMHDVLSRVVQTFGRLDAAFANAGVGAIGARYTELTFDEWHRVLAVNLDGVFVTLREAAAQMIALGNGGSLVATSSLTALQGAPRHAAYAASKAGVLGLIRTLAVELGGRGIRANALIPGWVDTPLNTEQLHSELFEQRVLPRVPLRRWGSPEDIAAAAVYLASPASGYHSGDALVIDGAYSLF